MADKLIRLALARLDTVQSVVPLRAHILTVVTHQTLGTHAMPIVLPALGIVLALAVVLAILSVLSIRTCLRTLISHPARRTITLASDVHALPAMPTIAFKRTIGSIPSLSTRMLTCSSCVSRGTFQGPCDMMTLLCKVLLALTLVVTILAVESFWARLITLVTDVPGRAVALSGHLVTGRVILAVTLFITFRPVETDWTLGFA